MRPVNERESRTLLNFDRWDCYIGLGLAGCVNLAMLCIAAALFHQPGLININDLGPVHAHLATLVGGGVALAFGVALIASGLSASSVDTYTGQIVMAGFINWKIPLILLTRRKDVMGKLVNRRITTVTMWVVTAIITARRSSAQK